MKQNSRYKARCSGASRNPSKLTSLPKAVVEDTRVNNPLVCQTCKEVCKNKKHLQLHVEKCHETKSVWQPELVSYHCNDCKDVFQDKISLSVHRMYKHGDSRRYQCEQCDYEGPRLYHLKRHLKVHSNERQYFCKECGKGFKSKAACQNHLVLHTNKGRFTCNTCSKAFNNRFVYEDHLRSHQSKKDFECNYCGTAFKTYKHVACHVRAVHLEDKRFICDVCGSKHMIWTNLKKHQETHRNIDSLPYAYQCSVCNTMFRGSGGLDTHMKVMHMSGSSQVSSATLGTPHPTRRSIKINYSQTGDAVGENQK